MFTLALYLLAAAGIAASFARDREKTVKALYIAKESFLRILPDFGTVLVIIGIMLTFLSPATISNLLGRESGTWGMLAAAAVGSVTLIPGFVAFPLAKSLLDCGAGIPQVAVFISRLEWWRGTPSTGPRGSDLRRRGARSSFPSPAAAAHP